MSLRFPKILQVLTTEWMPREEIERRVGGPCMSQLARLYCERRVLHMVDASQKPWVHKYCLPPNSVDMWIGTTHIARAACGGGGMSG